LSPIVPSAVEADAFLRQFVADNLPRVPAGVALIPTTAVTHASIATDSAFLRAILDNLLKNAVEAMPHGGEVRFDWSYNDDGERLSFTVSDSGEGMDPAMLRDLLQGTPISRKKTGSGVGMLTVRGMLRRLGGTIDGTSAVGQGTTWQLEIPSLAPLDAGDEPSRVAGA